MEWRRKVWPSYANIIPHPPQEILWQTGAPFVYPTAELQWLPPAHLEAVLRVYESRDQSGVELDNNWMSNVDDEDLTNMLNLWRPCEGYAPLAEMAGREHEAVLEKFHIPLQVACDMSQEYWCHKFPKKKIPLLQPIPVVQPALEGDTLFTVVDWDRNARYIRNWENAAKFKWCSMTAFSGWIVACMLRITQVFEVTREVNESSLKDIKQDPRYRKRADGGLMINAG